MIARDLYEWMHYNLIYFHNKIMRTDVDMANCPKGEYFNQSIVLQLKLIKK
jgi:hypothetical protein